MNGWLGVDWKQWRALVWASIKVDTLRSMASGGASAATKKRWHPLWGASIFYLITGLYFAVISLFLAEPFLSACIVLALVMALIASMILIEFHAVVISPDDFEVLGHQPIDSRTYFFARVANVLFYTMVAATAMGLFPMIAFFLQMRGGFAFKPWVGLAFIPALYLAALTATLASILVYATLANKLHPRRLRRVMGYFQILFSALFFGGYVFLPRLLDNQIVSLLVSEKSWWMLPLPPAWFAAYVELAQGRWGAMEWALAGCSLVSISLMTAYAARVISINYAERLSLMIQTSEANAAEKAAREAERSPRWFQTGERRAVALLIRNQFKHDNKFRLAVLGIVPLMFLYVAMAVISGDIRDPFPVERVASERPINHPETLSETHPATQEKTSQEKSSNQDTWKALAQNNQALWDALDEENQELWSGITQSSGQQRGMDQSFLFLIVLFMFPVMLKMNMTRSDSYPASWIFHSTPADKGRLVLAMKEFIVIFVLAPLLVVIGAIFWYFFGNSLHAAMHTLTLGLIAHLFVQLAFLLKAELPFSTPIRKGERINAIVMLIIVLPILFAFIGAPLLQSQVYTSPVRLAIFLAALIMLNLALEWSVRWRANYAAPRLQYME